MDLFYKLLVFLHVLSATASIGPFFVLLPLARKMYKIERIKEQAYLYIFQVSVRVIMHAGHALVVSGILLLLFGPWPWTTSWVMMTTAIMLGSAFFLAKAFSPTLKKFSKLKADRHTLAKKLERAVWIYIFLLLLMLWFMVAKPNLW